MENGKEIVYCSGPLFCPEEIGGMSAIAGILENEGYGTFLPHRDGLEYYLMRHVNSPVANLPAPKNLLARVVFALDVYQIVERCDSFVLNFNGRVPDEGAVAEAGIAYASGTPMIIYKNDNRTVFNGCDNSMVVCLSHAPLVSDIQKIPGVLKKVMEKAQGVSPYRGDNIPSVMRDTLKLGRKVWKTMKTLHLNGGEPGQDAELINQIADICKEHPDLNPTKDV
ncbi:MAG: nucleoside 2-deoxyribosyltransferase [Deltaproteobacteria bacterium]|nr:nucleoside 2-deoxyribosyltransferase [Deltaproteobacteria bacterium]